MGHLIDKLHTHFFANAKIAQAQLKYETLEGEKEERYKLLNALSQQSCMRSMKKLLLAEDLHKLSRRAKDVK